MLNRMANTFMISEVLSSLRISAQKFSRYLLLQVEVSRYARQLLESRLGNGDAKKWMIFFFHLNGHMASLTDRLDRAS